MVELGADVWALLEMTFQGLSEWASLKRSTDVNYSWMDTQARREVRLGARDEESSGTVMPRLLKEEFYRTLLHVAGRIPLWWVAPPGARQDDYEFIVRNLDRIQSTTLHPLDFIDLGFPEKPDPREFLGAAMWQAYKSQRDPFKAVLKMILILEQVEDNEAPLLRDQVKAALGATPPDDLPVDPYYMTIKRVLDFTEKRQPKNLELVRICSLFKLQTPFESHLMPEENKKSRVLRDLTTAWGWKEERISDRKSVV